MVDMARWTWGGAALLASLLASSIAFAQAAEPEQDVEPQAEQDELGRNHFRAGQSYFEQEQYLDAAREFEQAYLLSERPLLLVNIATSYERALQYDDARAALVRFLELSPDSPERSTLEARIRHYERVSASAAESGDSAPEPVQSASTGMGALGWTGVVGLGLGGASLVVALATGLAAEGTYGSLEMDCDGAGVCPTGTQAQIDEGAALALTSTVTFFIGTGLAVAGLALLLVDLLSGSDDDAQARLRPNLAVAPGLAAVTLDGSF